MHTAMKKLQDRIGQIYYTHGLFCASHPWAIISFVIGSFLFTCYPLSNLPLLGETPSEYITPVADYKVPPSSPPHGPPTLEEDGERKPIWYLGLPAGYVQQIVVKGTVSPWVHEQLVPLDAFRAPLYTVFDILDEIQSFVAVGKNGTQSLSDICLRISEPVIKHIDGTLPKYTCLVVSPAYLWQRDRRRFRNDPRIIKTVYERHYQTIEARPGLKDILFGLPWKSTGIRKYFIRNRQRTISYAVTIIMKKYDPVFISALKNKLQKTYHEKSNGIEIDQISHLHYKNVNYFVEYTPLLVTYFVLLLYLYFSVSKIDMVKSKIGLAFSAVVSVVASLLMSIGLCTWFGLTPSLNGGEIFPYLVVIIGLENVLIITKSVVSTPVHLDVKYRTAQGLSKEGWYITKHLVTELGILLFGFLTFVPAIQEFCLFAVVGLLTDFYLQMVFFATVLSVDIRRMELSDLHKQNVAHEVNTRPGCHYEPLVRCPVMMVFSDPASTHRKHRSYSARVSDPAGDASTYVDDMFCPRPRVMEVPKRLRFIFFWAKTRMFQRLIMMCTIIWISLIVYKTGLVEHLTSTDEPLPNSLSPTSWPTDMENGNPVEKSMESIVSEQVAPISDTDQSIEEPAADDWYRYYWKYDQDDLPSVSDVNEAEPWRMLSDKHWPSLFGCYNVSLSGRYISILPTISLGTKISPQYAIKLRHPDEGVPAESLVESKESRSKDTDQTQLNMLKSLYDTKQLKEFIYDPSKIKEFYPKSKKELITTVWLGFLSVVVITYFMVILYKCMCSRRYDKWRVSWSKMRRKDKMGGYYKQIKDAVPLVLKGHLQEIECLVTDGQYIVSACLGGEIRVWDSFTGECLTGIIRKSVTPPPSRKPCLGRNMDDSDADLYAEYHGNGNSYTDHNCSSCSASESSLFSPSEKLLRNHSKTSFDSEPDLSTTIDTDFSQCSCANQSAFSTQSSLDITGTSPSAFDFSSRFQDMYNEHQQQTDRRSTSQLQQSMQGSTDGRDYDMDSLRSKSWSAGDTQDMVHYFANTEDSSSSEVKSTAIWCLASRDNLIVAGCGNGRLEFWDGATGGQKCIYAESTSAVTALCFVMNRIVIARLNGMIDFLEIETFQNPILSPHTSKPHPINCSQRTHPSRHCTSLGDMKCWDNVVRCTKVQTVKAHQKPVNVLLCENNRVVSASQDHSLKADLLNLLGKGLTDDKDQSHQWQELLVFRLEDCLCLYTLHGHTSSVTSLYLDKCPPYAAVSGSPDNTVRLWDLSTGTCVHKLSGHSGAVTSITCTSYYIISMGLDDKLCVWERSRGLMMHKFPLDPCSNGMALLTSNYLITGAKGSLYLWDINRGECLKRIKLEETDGLSFVQQIEYVDNSTIVCDYGTQLKVVRFPTTLEKMD